MGFKAQAQAQPVEHAGEVIVKIEGLRSIGADEFAITGLRWVQVDYSAVDTLLAAAGIPTERIPLYVESFAEMVGNGELAAELARRIKRVA